MLRFASSRTAAVSTACRWYTVFPELTKPAGGKASLPALDWDLEAGLQPIFSKRQMELHYSKHHKAYVDKLNVMTEGKPQYDGKNMEEIAEMAQKESNQPLFNQAAQHFNHSFYWKCLTPNGSAIPTELEAQLKASFGSVEEFKKEFEAKGVANFGSGWTWLVYNPTEKKLAITNTSNAGFPLLSEGSRPLLTIDVWEHAYYKDFENRRPDYLAEVWKAVNWEFVAAQLKKASA